MAVRHEINDIERKSRTVKTINATEGGVIFVDGIECMTFENFLNNYKR